MYFDFIGLQRELDAMRAVRLDVVTRLSGVMKPCRHASSRIAS
jgi:hypothetical protein